MAEVTKTLNLLVCDRCAEHGRETKALVQASITLGDQTVKMDLCGMHQRALYDVWFAPKNGKRSRSTRAERVLNNPVSCPACGREAKNLYAMGQHTHREHPAIAEQVAQLNARVRDLRDMNETPQQQAELTSVVAKLDELWAEERIRNQVRSRAEDEARV